MILSRRVALPMFLTAIAAAAQTPPGDRLASLTRATHEIRLPNGLQVLVVEPPQSPIVMFHLRARAGMADEPAGQTGLAQLAIGSFLQGSELWGSRNPAGEKAAFDEAENLLATMRAEQAKGEQIDDIKQGRLDTQARMAYQRSNEFTHGARFVERVLMENGGTGFESSASVDYADLAMTMPSLRAELWFRMVGAWLHAPSLRYFYDDRRRYSEPRQRSAMQVRMAALGGAFPLHPYQGLMSDGDAANVLSEDVAGFLKTHYVPANLTIAIVGDITAADVRRWAEQYLGKLPSAPAPQARSAVAPKLEGQSLARVAVPGQWPVAASAWPRPDANSPDDPVFDIVQGLFIPVPGSRVHAELLGSNPTVRSLSTTARYPGARYPALFLVEGEPAPGRSLEEVDLGIQRVLTAMKTELPAADDMARARAWWRSRFLGEAHSASGRAAQLARLQTEYGGYKVEERLAKLNAVTPDDCRRVVNQYLGGQHFALYQLTAVEGAEAQ
ncbi:MAG: insulinase family protein [Acidobacteria bacterium]|nr:insulinase family protein [Acidobacteriota bacterium]